MIDQLIKGQDCVEKDLGIVSWSLERERDDLCVLSTEVPGVKREEVDISVDGDELTVKFASRKKNGGCVWQLRSDVDKESIKAKMEDGILKIFLPRILSGRKIALE